MMKSRQVLRREFFKARFERYEGHVVPKDMPSRSERRKLARAYAAGDWRKRTTK